MTTDQTDQRCALCDEYEPHFLHGTHPEDANRALVAGRPLHDFRFAIPGPMSTDQTITQLLAMISRRFDDPTVPAARKTDALTLLRRVADSLKP